MTEMLLIWVFFGLCTLDELWVCNTLFYPLPQWEAGVACSSHLFPSSCGISHLGCLPANYLCHEVRTFPTGSALHMDDPPPRLGTLKLPLTEKSCTPAVVCGTVVSVSPVKHVQQFNYSEEKKVCLWNSAITSPYFSSRNISRERCNQVMCVTKF